MTVFAHFPRMAGERGSRGSRKAGPRPPSARMQAGNYHKEPHMNPVIRTIPLVAIALLVASSAFAAERPAAAPGVTPGYVQGRWVVSGSLGLGLASIYGTDGTPLFAATAEVGVTPTVSVGGAAGAASSTYRYFDYTAKYSYTVVAARGSYHFTEVATDKPVDLYVGGSLGYNRVGVSESGPYLSGYSVGASYVLYGVHAGARWYFTPRAAGFAELGYGLGAIAVGASLRL